MSLKALIANQTIRIDDHQWGSREEKDWDDASRDIHIDKSTNTRVNGKRQKLQIRIPINSDRPVKVGNKRNFEKVPRSLEKEIQDALNDRQSRDEFVSDVLKVLEGFKTTLNSEQRARAVLSQLSKHFDLQWTGETITRYAREVLMYFAQLYRDNQGLTYFATIDREKVELGQNNGYARFFKRLSRKQSRT